MVDEARVLVREAVVILLPDVGRQQVVERGDRPAPFDLAGGLQPFGVLVDHRIHHVDEGLVAGEEAVPAGEEVAFQPALAKVFAEHLHHPAVGAEVGVDGLDLGHPDLARDVVDGVEPVGGGLIWAEQAEVARLQIERDDVAKVGPQHPRGFRLHGAWAADFDRIVTEVRRR